MRLTKSLLCGISALALATGAAFAGQDSTVHPSALELSNAYEMTEQQYALEESDVISVYPVEVTEYYLVIPSESSEMPG